MVIAIHRQVRWSTTSVKQWYARQSTDPFVKAAVGNYRSRAAFKLEELQQKYRIIENGSSVLDLGSSPGGWTQIAAKYALPRGHVTAVDLLPMDAVPGVRFIQGNMQDEAVQRAAVESLGGLADAVLSDMAHGFVGSRTADVPRLLELCHTALSVALRVLRPNGHFVCKFIRGDGENELERRLMENFKRVELDKPAASRSESAEAYFVCLRRREYPIELVDSGRSRSRQSDQKGTRSEEVALPPSWTELDAGVRVLASINGCKSLQAGVVESVLSRDFHSKGVRVRLADGRVGRATKLA
ncbi:FtsJ-like methyltransferase-domain-containing protein [Zopfochytrium polystomum]|nr:FtsJ-like methyltransferase-domain-containing protein [Zopfochytrium polystomum]